MTDKKEAKSTVILKKKKERRPHVNVLKGNMGWGWRGGRKGLTKVFESQETEIKVG